MDRGSRGPDGPGGGGGERALALLAVVLLTAGALWARLATIGFGTPFFQESDAHVFRQVHLLGLDEELTPELWKETSIYPHLFARTVLLFPDPIAQPIDAHAMSLEQHLDFAGAQQRLVRSVVAVASVLLIPATWFLARALFGPGWSLFATALCALSLLNLQFGQIARPHAFAAPFMALAVAAAVRLRQRPTLVSYLLCGIAGALSIGALQSGLAVLGSFAAAFLLRDPADLGAGAGAGVRRRWLEPRLIVPVLLMAASVRYFWPFAFIDAPGAETGVQDGTIRISDQTLAFSEFTGEGFPTVLLTVWYYESVTFVLALAGLALFAARPILARVGRALPRPPGAGRDLLVMLAFALPYLVTIGLHERAQQRFVIPLLPFAALLATAGLAGLAELVRARRGLVAAAVALCLAVPLAATVRYTLVRLRPHTQAEAGAWIAAHVPPEERVGLHLTYDVPLARRLDNLFQADGERRAAGVFVSPWLHHQWKHMDASWPGERRDLDSMYVPAETDFGELLADPESWLIREGYRYVVTPDEHVASFHPIMNVIRLAAANIGTLVAEFPEGERMRVETKYEGLDTPHFTAFCLTTPRFGPGIEIYRLEERR